MATIAGGAAQATRLLSAPMVTVAGRLFRGREVVAAALVAGLWEPFERVAVARLDRSTSITRIRAFTRPAPCSARGACVSASVGRNVAA